MYLQLGKKKNKMSPLVVGAAGILVGATAAALADERNRKLLSKKLTKTSKQAKGAINQLQQHASQLQQKITDTVSDATGSDDQKGVQPKQKVAVRKDAYQERITHNN